MDSHHLKFKTELIYIVATGKIDEKKKPASRIIIHTYEVLALK